MRYVVACVRCVSISACLGERALPIGLGLFLVAWLIRASESFDLVKRIWLCELEQSLGDLLLAGFTTALISY
jgi:hypothetical protein